MARWNLKVNYGTVRDVAEAAKALAGGIDSVKNELKNVENAITNCAGAAITVLEEKSPDMQSNLEKLKDGLNSLGDIFNEYADNMLGIINYGDGGLDSVVHINTNQVKGKLGKMADDTSEFLVYATGINPSVSGEFLSPFREITDADKANIAGISNKLDSIKEMMIEVGKYIGQYADDFEKMRVIVGNYENMDDEMKSKIKDLYNDLADIKWWQTTTFKVIVGATLVIAAVAAIILIPAAAVGAAAFALGVAKGIVGFAALNVAIGSLSAYLSGDDIEDAVATGLFEGSIEGIFVGGTSTAGKMLGTVISKSSLGKKVIASSKYITADNMVKFFEFNTEYLGQVANTTFKTAYNGNDVNMMDIALNEALKHSWKAMDKLAMADINKIFKGRADAIINNGSVNEAKDLFINKSMQKVSQYTAKAGNYFSQIGVDAVMNEINTSVQNGENISISDIYNSMADKYDGTKLLKYVIKDDFKKTVVDQVGRFALNKK